MYYSGWGSKTYVWTLVILLIVVWAASLSGGEVWRMWFVAPFTIFFLYICRKFIFNPF